MEPVSSSVSIVMWIAFWVIVLAALFIDLAVMNKHKGHVSIKEAAVMVGAWISLALLFGGAIWFFEGSRHALEFYTGYVLEYSLSIDNMFVFIMIFGFFAVPNAHKPSGKQIKRCIENFGIEKEHLVLNVNLHLSHLKKQMNIWINSLIHRILK